jgi:hypothetical protein
MGLCAVKRGIISLRDCGQEATDTCSTCARAICREHTKVSAGSVLCVECYARREEEALRDAAKGSRGTAAKGAAPARAAGTARTDEWDDPAWPYLFRHTYYTHSSYHPFYSGSYYDTYYDSYDLRSFNHHSGGPGAFEEDADAGGFYDS